MHRQGYENNIDNDLQDTFRKLWEQHILWTRSFIISTAEGLKDLDVVTKRLLRNPEDFANVFKRFYGEQVADEFKRLFEQHLLIAADLVNSAKAGNRREVEENRAKWYANADNIAVFLSRINPNWSRREWQDMLYSHLRMTEMEAVRRLNGQYADDVSIYDDIEDQALKMADYMYRGISRQFGA
ncbi:MAG: acetylglutamate kinase [Bacillota bacterium]|nr:acetylglutamate kinase [Bacillota bacterium]